MRALSVLACSLGVAMIGGTATALPDRGAPEPVRLTFIANSSACLALADGSRRRGLVRLQPPRGVSRLSWSPAGKYAALLRGASLVVVDQRGHVLRQVIRHFTYGSNDPVWSPDGRWIAVESDGHGPGIGIVPARGGGWRAWRELWSPGDLDSGADSPTWTPDSRHLAFAAHLFNHPASRSGVYAIGIDGSGFRLLVPDAVMPAYSPDGLHLAYVDAGGIWVSDADGTNPVRVTESGGDARPAWSPRGRLIAFERTVNGHTSIHAVRPDGSGERTLVSSPRYDATLPSWRPAAPFRGGPRRPCP